MSTPQFFRTPSGDDMVILSKADYEALIDAANEAAEDAADAAIYAERKAALRPQDILPVEVSAFITKGDNRVRAFRKWRGLSQQELSERAGLAQGFLSDLENRKRTLTEDVAAKLRKALDLPDNWLRT